MSKKQYTPQELCDAIYQAVLNADHPLSRREIVDAIQRKKSPHVLAMIDHLLTEGYFRSKVVKMRNGRTKFIYEVVAGSNPDCEGLE